MISTAKRFVRPQLWAGLVLLLACTTLAAATNSAWFTRVWRTSDGLPNNNVAAITQGRDGYLWVATPVGLARFDGVRFTPFSYRVSGKGEDQGVRALLPGHSGGLWIVPNQGPVVYLDAQLAHSVSKTNGWSGLNVPLNALEGGDGSVWIAYSSRTIVEIANGKPARIVQQGGATPRLVYSLTADADGGVWVAAGNPDVPEVGVFRDGQFQSVARFKFGDTPRVAAARSNGVWIANGTQLFKCEGQGKLETIGQFQPDAPRAQPVVLMEDHTGRVWIGTVNNGLFCYDGSGFVKVETSHPQILCLTEDDEGNIWAGTAGGGLDRINSRSVKLEGLDADSSLVAIQSVCEDTNGVLWGATQNGLLVSRVDGKWIPVLTNEPWLGVVTCVASDRNGGLWIGTGDRHLHHWQNGSHTTWSRDDGMKKITITALLPGSNGDLWIGGYATGVPCLRDGKFHVLKTPAEAGRVLAMTEDAGGNIWIGTSRGYLMRAEGDRFVNETPHTSDMARAIRSLYATPDGALWIGYEGLGLGRLKNGEFSRIGTEQGLSDDYISQIIADDSDLLWFGSDHGIFKIRQQELEEVMQGQSDSVRPINYGRNEGSLNMEADFGFLPGALRSRDGQLWIPMRTALAVIDTKVYHANPKPPTVLLTRVALDGQTIAVFGGLSSNQAVANLKTLERPLRLPPGHRKVDFDFTAFSFSAPENIHFRFRLDGLDSDWVDGETSSATYSRLAAGNYRFHVEASNGDGPWHPLSAPLGIVVTPFFWQTLWFRFGVLAFFTSAVIGAVRYISFRRLRAKLWRLEQQAALDKERTRIARDLHDDLGCSLTEMALTLDMTRRESDASDQVKGTIQRCSSMVRQAAKSVDEIVWAINPRNDTLRYMIDYISQFAVEFLHAAGIRCRVDLPESLPNLLITPEARHNLFLVVKEALNNITRHAHASEVQLHITASEQQVAITIEDNGRGFEHVPDNASSDGLRNMRQRMEEITGHFQLESRTGAGTRVSFIYSWPPNSGA